MYDAIIVDLLDQCIDLDEHLPALIATPDRVPTPCVST